MVTIPGELNMDISNSTYYWSRARKWERNGINESKGAKRRCRKGCSVSCISKKRH